MNNKMRDVGMGCIIGMLAVIGGCICYALAGGLFDPSSVTFAYFFCILCGVMGALMGPPFMEWVRCP